MEAKITFLGTSNAMPTAKRSHPAMVLEWSNEHILVDCGEGTQRQYRLANMNPCKLTRILLTHLHGDHVLGLPGLLKTLEMSNYSKKLHIYGPKGLQRHMHLLQELYGRFGLQHEIHEVQSSQVVNEKDFEIQSQKMDHTTQTLAYAFIVKEKRHIDKTKLAKLKISSSPLLKKLQQGKAVTIDGKKLSPKNLTYADPGKKVTFILDTKFNNSAINLAKKSDLVICEATYANSEEEKASEYKHLTAKQAATIAKKAGAKQLALTHISQRYDFKIQNLEKEAREVFKSSAVIHDFDQITVS